MPAVRAGRLVLRRRRVATSAADGRACLISGRSSPVCSVRSQLHGPLGGCSCRATDRGYERGAFGARVALRTCQARAALHTVRKTAINWRVSNIAAGSGRLWQGASARCQVLSQVKLCEKKELRTAEFNLALFLRTRLSGCWRAPHQLPALHHSTKAHLTMQQRNIDEGAPNFFIAHSPSLQTAAWVLSIRHCSAVKK